MEVEIWKDIPDYEGLYQVSDLGRVRSLDKYVKNHSKDVFKKGKIMKQSLAHNGYFVVSLTNEAKKRVHTVHTLVAMAFLGHKPNGFKVVVDHKNDIKTDNRKMNLRLVTNRINATKKNRGISKYVGVTYCNKAEKWLARIYKDKKTHHIGSFDTEFQAHLAYQRELRKIRAKEKAPI